MLSFSQWCESNNYDLIEEKSINDLIDKDGRKDLYTAKDVDVSDSGLTTLKGSENLSGVVNFNCSGNKLKDLVGGPKTVKGDYDCSNNTNLKILIDGPSKVGGDFICTGNKSMSYLAGIGEIHGTLDASNSGLITFAKGPAKVLGSYIVSGCNINSFKGAPKKIMGDFDVSNNKIKDLKECPAYVDGDFNLKGNPGKFTEEDIKEVCDVKGKIVL